MKISAITAILRSPFHAPGNRRNTHRHTNPSACVSVEVCEPKLLLSATVDDHVNQRGPDATAVTIDPATSSLRLKGFIGSNNDGDYFQVDVPVDSLISLSWNKPFTVNNQVPGGPAYLVGLPSMSAVSSSGDFVDLSIDPQSRAMLPAGHWVFSVGTNPDFGSADYSITVNFEPAPLDDHPDYRGPDATVITPDPVTSELTFSGEFRYINDHDVFQFHLDQPAALTLKWDSAAGPNGGSFRIYDAEGKEKFYADDFALRSTGRRLSLEAGQMLSLDAGQWYLKVSGRFGSDSGAYSLRGQLDDPPVIPPPVETSYERINIWPDTTVNFTFDYLMVARSFNVLPVEVTQLSDLHLPATAGVQAVVTDSNGNVVRLKGDMARLDIGTYFITAATAAYSANHLLVPVYVDAVQITAGIGRSIDPTPNLKWDAVEGARSYEVYISVKGRSDPVFRQNGIKQTAFEVPVDLQNGGYTVWVKARLDGDRQSYWGKGYNLNIVAPPRMYAFAKNGSEITWSPANGAVRYEVQIQKASGDRSIVLESAETKTQFSVSNSLAAGAYSARVRATDNDGTVGDWSTALPFQVYAPPVAITGGTATTVDATPMITWRPVSGVSNYDVWIGLKGSKIQTYRMNGLTTTQHRVSIPLTPGSYDVFVRAHLANGSMSRWGSGTALQIGSPPVVTSQGRTVSWQPITGATRYELWVNRIDAQGKYVAYKVIHDDQVLGTSFTLPSPSGKFRVWIRAIRNEAGGTYYSHWSRSLDV